MKSRAFFAVIYFMAVIFSLRPLGLKAQALVAANPANPFYGWLQDWAPGLILLTGFIILGWGLASLFKR